MINNFHLILLDEINNFIEFKIKIKIKIKLKDEILR